MACKTISVEKEDIELSIRQSLISLRWQCVTGERAMGGELYNKNCSYFFVMDEAELHCLVPFLPVGVYYDFFLRLSSVEKMMQRVSRSTMDKESLGGIGEFGFYVCLNSGLGRCGFLRDSYKFCVTGNNRTLLP